MRVGGVGRLGAEVLGQACLACLLFLGGFLGVQPRMGAFVRLHLRGVALSFFLYSFGPGQFPCPMLSFISRTCFCVAVAVGRARRLDIRGRYKSLREATV